MTCVTCRYANRCSPTNQAIATSCETYGMDCWAYEAFRSEEPALAFHHLGLAVRQPEPTMASLEALGYRCSEIVTDPEQNVRLVMCSHPTSPAVEIISPTDTVGPLGGILRWGGTSIYHLCYETPDVERAVAQMANGSRVTRVVAPKPAVLFGGRKVSFYHVPALGLVELLEAE